MKNSVAVASLIALTLFLAGCVVPVTIESEPMLPAPESKSVGSPRSAVEALAPFYAQLEYDKPVAIAGPALPPSDAVLTSIAFGSCSTGEQSIPILRTITREEHDLFMFLGDNVYGRISSEDATGNVLREAYHQLADRSEFQALRQRFPMLAIWDDHDYGRNDAGGSFVFKGFSEKLFLDFWGAPENDIRRSREGIYAAHTFGPAGERVQIILLDTRYFRTDLTATDERGAVGRERYVPSTDPEQSILGPEQWAWLEDQLRKPADVRLLVSSIQVHADGHGWEAWRTMPLEQERLYQLIDETEAQGVVLLSGDRHSSGLYVRDDVAPYPLYEITSSSLNLSRREENNEPGSHRIGDMYAPDNFGVIGLNWDDKMIALQIKAIDGSVVRERIISMDEIGVR